MKFTGLDIICVLDSNEFIFQGTGKILKKKKKKTIIARCTSPIFISGITRASSELLFLNVVAQMLSCLIV